MQLLSADASTRAYEKIPFWFHIPRTEKQFWHKMMHQGPSKGQGRAG